MKITPIALAASLFLTSAVPLLSNVSWAADSDNPLDPSHMTDQQKAYFKDKVSKMDSKGEGKITREGFLGHYDRLWDQNAPRDKSAVTINELSAKWAAMETQNPLDPEYKTAIMRKDHVKLMDTDNNDTITKVEFIKHMDTHWIAETKLSQSSSLTHEQAMQAISRNPLDPNYKH